ncbi:MAG: hypothetical protein L0215_01655 [Gemmataceae bacterium]|nr:hypothetical protein [Gemmataceae bacterium]
MKEVRDEAFRTGLFALVVGRILAVAYRGRGTWGTSELAKVYSDFRAVDGLTLPHAVRTIIDGQPVTHTTTTFESITINGPVDPKLFALPSAVN